MKTNLAMFNLVPRRSWVAVLSGLCAFAPVSSRALETVVNNMGDSIASYSGFPLGQVFTMSSSAGNEISSLALQLNVTVIGSAEVDLYDVSAGSPSVLIQNLGNVTAGSTGDTQTIAVGSLNNGNYSLIANHQYAIVLQNPGSGSIGWDFTESSSTGGTSPDPLGGIYYNTGSWHPTGGYLQMDLVTTPVPEVPVTGVVMGFGALAIALGNSLRRKHTAASSIV